MRRQLAQLRHRFQSSYWFQRANQHASRLPFRFAGDIQTVIHPIDKVDVREAGWPEQHRIALRPSCKCVRRWIVQSKIRLNLYNPAGKQLALVITYNQFSQ